MAYRAVLESLFEYYSAIASLYVAIKAMRRASRHFRRIRQKAGQEGHGDSDLGDPDDGGIVERG